MKTTLAELKRRRLVNVAFLVHPDDAKYVQDKYDESVPNQEIKTSLSNYWAAALQGLNISPEAKKERQPKIKNIFY